MEVREGTEGKEDWKAFQGALFLLQLTTYLTKYLLMVFREIAEKTEKEVSEGNGYNVIYTIDISTSTPKIELERGQKTFYRLGLNGSAGFNADGCAENPDDPGLLETPGIENMVAEHKSWLREISGLLINDESLLMFYRRLYDNSNLSSLHNVSYLLKELKDIDEKYIKLKTDVDILPFHKSALYGASVWFCGRWETTLYRTDGKNLQLSMGIRYLHRYTNICISGDEIQDYT